MKRVRAQNRVIQMQAIKVRVFVVLILMVAVLLSGYVGMLALSVKNVVLRKESEAKTALLRVEVSKMEHEYITRVGDITLVRADGIGLSKVASKSFAERRILVGQAN